MKIDLNADLGEGMGDDEAMMPYLSSCNIACGGHAGDKETMRATLKAAKQAGLACGAHPSYPDRPGFGRRPFKGNASILATSLYAQLVLLSAIAEEEGVRLTHVKPHGALYHAAAADLEQARFLASAVTEYLPDGALVGPPGSQLKVAAEEAGLSFVAEGFADRRYLADGKLMPRTQTGSVLEDVSEQIEQALALGRGEDLSLPLGKAIKLQVQTICLHGDTPGAVHSAQAIHAALEEAGVRVEAPYG